MVKKEMKTEKKRENKDSIAKIVFRDPDVLAQVVKDVIPEFKGFEREEI